MTEAVIVSTARTPLCKSWRGALNMTHGATMGGHAVKHAIERAQARPGGDRGRDHRAARTPRARPAGTSRARSRSAPAARSTTSGITVNRFCSSGLQTIALAAQRIMTGEGEIYAAGGVESISCVQNEMNKHMFIEDWLKANKPEIYWPMLQTAEYVAKKYKIPREPQDRYGVQSQLRAAAAREAGKFKDEIVPITTQDEGRRQGRPAPRR